MTHGDLEDMVKRFFAKAGRPSLLLPDGWFGGRPMENSHQLTFISQRPKRLIFELDDQLLLSFTPSVDVHQTVSDHARGDGTPTLVFDGYQQLVFEHLDYGSDTPHVQTYEEGAVRLIAPR